MVELWKHDYPFVTHIEGLAQRTEAEGWDGLMCSDSQNLFGDTYVGLAVAAQATSKIKLGTDVTTPVTRHPSVTAAAITGIQVLSEGRAVIGIGRGDSALSQIGLPPVSLGDFEQYVERTQGYLAGESVDLEGFESYSQWIPTVDQPKVPLEVAASGPKVIDIAARHADGIRLALGADVERVAWGIKTAREAREKAGRDSDSFPIAAVVVVVAHDDIDTARHLARGGLGTLIRFATMPGGSKEGFDEKAKGTLKELASKYNIRQHATAGAGHAGALDADFVDRFAVVGNAQMCVERLSELSELGLDRLVVYSAPRDTDPALKLETDQLFASEVLPALH